MGYHRPQVVPILLELEREDNIDQLGTDARLLDIGKTTPSTVSDAHFGNFVVTD